MELLSGKHNLQNTKVTKSPPHISTLIFVPAFVQNKDSLGVQGKFYKP